ncbi:MAG: translocation/assembly module TamB domain-containing protein [Planctomycetes bacterium]|nr:translocation/assembly module TamB domain-containing protein [Planctomycetota bacterium]
MVDKKKRRRTKVLAALLFFCGLVVLAYVFREPLFGEIVRRELESSLSEALGQPVEVGRLVAFEPGKVEVENVHLVRPERPFAAFRLDVLEVEFSTWRLLTGGERPIERVRASGVELEIDTAAAPEKDLEERPGPSDFGFDPAPVLAALPDVEVDGAQIVWKAGALDLAATIARAVLVRERDESCRLVVEARELSLARGEDRRVFLDGVLEVVASPSALSVERVSWHGGEFERPLALDLKDLAESRVRLESLELRSGTESLVARGEVRMEGGKRRHELSIEECRVRLDSRRFSFFLETPVDFDCLLEGTGQAKLDVGKAIEVGGWVGFAATGAVAGRRIERSRLELALQGDRIRLSSCDLAGEGIQLAASGSAGTDLSLDVAVEASVDLARAPVPGEKRPDLGGLVKIAGRLSGRFLEPRFKGEAAWESPRLGEREFRAAGTVLAYAGGRAALTGAWLEDAAGNRLEATGEIRPFDGPTGELAGTLQVSRPRDLLAGLGIGADLPEGTAGIEFTVDLGEKALSVAGLRYEAEEGTLDLSMRARLEDGGGIAGELAGVSGSFRGVEFATPPGSPPVTFSVAGGKAKLGPLTLAVEDALVSAGGSADLEEETLDVAIEIKNLSADLARRALATEKIEIPADLAGVFSGSGRVQGPWSEPRARGALASENLAWGGLSGGLSATGSFAGGSLSIDRGRLEHGPGSVEFSGKINVADGAQLDLVAGLADLPVDVLGSLVPEVAEASGRLSATLLVIRGPALSPEVEGELRLTGGRLVFADTSVPPLDDLAATLRFEPGRARIESGSLTWLDAPVTFHGALVLPWENPRFEVELGFKELDLARLPWGLEFRLAGLAWGHATAAGSLGGIETASVDLHGVHVSAWGVPPCEIALAARYDSAARAVEIQSLALSGALSGGRGDVAIRGRLLDLVAPGGFDPMAVRLDLSVTSSVDLAVLSTLVEAVESAAGHVSMEGLTVCGTAGRPEAFGEIAIRDGALSFGGASPPVSSVAGLFRCEGRRVVLVSLAGTVLGRKLSVQRGSIDFHEKRSPEVRTSFAISPMPLAEVARFLSRLGPGDREPALLAKLGGEVSIALEVSGDLDRPRVKADLLATGVAYETLSISRLAVSAELLEGRLHLAPIDPVKHFDSNFLAVERSGGSLPLEVGPGEGPGKVELALRFGSLGKLGPGLAKGYERLDLSGTLALAVSGSLAEPEVEGELVIEGGGFHAAGSPIVFEDLRGRVRYSDGELRIGHGELRIEDGDEDVVSMKVTGGDLSISGTVGLFGPTAGRLRVAVEGHQVLVYRYDDFIFRVSPHLTIEGARERPTVRGTVTIDRATYMRDFIITDPKVSIRAQEEEEKPAREPAEGEGGAIPVIAGAVFDDVKIVSEGGISIKNSVCEGYADADLHLTGSTDSPILLGKISLREGEAKIFFQQNLINVTFGEFVFTREELLVPRIRMVGRARVDRYDVTLEVRGDRHDLRILPQSNPVLTEEQILNLLVSGTVPPERGGAAESGMALETLGRSLPYQWESKVLNFEFQVTLTRIVVDLGSGFWVESYPDPAAGAVLGVSYRLEFD